MNFPELVDPDTSFCTLSIFKFPKKNRIWAMKMMYYGKSWLKETDGLRFWKLLGSAKGFGPLNPDLSQYGLFAVWENAASAQEFFDNSKWIKKYKDHADNSCTIAMSSYQSRGSWSGSNPFTNLVKKPEEGEPIAVLTRGSIKFTKALAFWKHEPEISKSLKTAPGLIATAGLGEYPLFRQVTYSIWEDENSMINFAQGNSAHGKAARAAFDNGYFSEWMFTRLKILAINGEWPGKGSINIKKDIN